MNPNQSFLKAKCPWCGKKNVILRRGSPAFCNKVCKTQWEREMKYTNFGALRKR